MKTKCSLNSYLFHLKHIMVAPKLLGVLHLLTQIGLVVCALFAIFAAMRAGINYGILVLLACIIGVPLGSFVIRAYFELLMIPFAISKNIRKIKKGMFDCGCDCGCGCDIDCNLDAHEEEPLTAEEIMLFNQLMTGKQENPISVHPITKKSSPKKETKKPTPKKVITKEPTKKVVTKKETAKKTVKKGR